MQVFFKCKRNIKSFFFIKAKDLVTTWSLGVWKKSIELDVEEMPLWKSLDVAPRFYPPLTKAAPSVKDGLELSGMGSYTKIAIAFKKKFWSNREYFLSAAVNGEFKGDFVPVIQNLDRRGLYKGSKILVALTFGPRSRDVTSQPDETTLEQVLGVLSDMFEAEIMAIFDHHPLVMDDLKDYMITDWNNDPLFYGAYSLKKPFVTDEQIAALAGPLRYAP